MIPNFDFEYVTYEELYNAYLDCRRRKRHTANAASFEVNLSENLYSLWLDLNKRSYTIGKSIVFVVDKPVKREVFAADFRDRIVHHLLINRIMPHFEETVINNSFSCRIGKGTLCAAKTLEKDAYNITNGFTEEAYVLKCDLKSFFMSIDKEKLYAKISKLISEKVYPNDEKQCEFSCWLANLIIMNKPQEGCSFRCPKEKWNGLPSNKSLFSVDEKYGIPIGNLSSQIFANYFLDEFDKFIIFTLGFSYYGRYVDDFYILDTDREKLMKIIPVIREYLKNEGITLHPKKVYLQSIYNGVKFVGSVIKPKRTYIANRTIGNFKNLIHKAYCSMQNHVPTQNEIEYFIGAVNSYLGFMKYHNTFNIRRKLLSLKEMIPWYDYCYTNSQYQKLTPYKEYRESKKGVLKKDVFNHPEKYNLRYDTLPVIVIDKKTAR